jgi:hypothetical protein
MQPRIMAAVRTRATSNAGLEPECTAGLATRQLRASVLAESLLTIGVGLAVRCAGDLALALSEEQASSKSARFCFPPEAELWPAPSAHCR